jgi:hypothetical protein
VRTAIGAVGIALLALLVWPSTVERDIRPHPTEPMKATSDASAEELARLREALASSEAERERLKEAIAQTEERVRSFESTQPQFWFEDKTTLHYRSPWPTR